VSYHTHPGANPRPVRARRPTKAERSEVFVLVLIMLAVGIGGRCRIVQTRTRLDHAQQPRRHWRMVRLGQRRYLRTRPGRLPAGDAPRSGHGQPSVYPMFLLGTALVISITAQLAVAKPGPGRRCRLGIPALAFAGLAKLIFGKPPRTEPTPKSRSTNRFSPHSRSRSRPWSSQPSRRPRQSTTFAKIVPGSSSPHHLQSNRPKVWPQFRPPQRSRLTAHPLNPPHFCGTTSGPPSSSALATQPTTI
jgi:hypothetical protein